MKIVKVNGWDNRGNQPHHMVADATTRSLLITEAIGATILIRPHQPIPLLFIYICFIFFLIYLPQKKWNWIPIRFFSPSIYEKGRFVNTQFSLHVHISGPKVPFCYARKPLPHPHFIFSNLVICLQGRFKVRVFMIQHLRQF